MKKILISINGETHEVASLKIEASGYKGHNLVKNQSFMNKVDYVFIQHSDELLSKKDVKDIKKLLKKIDGGES